MKAWRHYSVLVLFLLSSGALALRVGYLTVTERDFLQEQGNARSVRTEDFPAHRGGIFDRHGEPLALSTPVSAVWADPSRGVFSSKQIREIASVLRLDVAALEQTLAPESNKQFAFIKRQVAQAQVQDLRGLDIEGLNFSQEYKRFYPAAESAAHVVGKTSIDDLGLEGIELAFDDRLRGRPGAKRVLKDRRGDVIATLDYLRPAQYGQDLALSIDMRLQYFAYRELKSAVAGQSAAAASLVLLDARSGEILALANAPSYNPNEPQTGDYRGKRNLAVTDTYEPGSTIKPFTLLAALESGSYSATSVIDTSPGYMRVGKKLIEDPLNRGSITLARALQKSSQVAIAKLALALKERVVFEVLARAGIGDFIGTGLPGEATGYLTDEDLKRPITRVTLAYGYGLSASPLQLAQAYLTLAARGQRIPLSILKREGTIPGEQVFDEHDTRAVLEMMELVTHAEGTAPKARIPNYRVAGKTGTARKLYNGRYDDERHVALFAGVAPVSDPRIVMVVVVDEPGTRATGGGAAAAPIFARVGERALRLLGVVPDAPLLIADGPGAERS